MHKIKRQIKRFLIAGSCAAATDAVSYFILLNILSHSPSKALAFIAGTLVAYAINKYYTFEQPTRCYKEAIRFSLLYATTFTINVASNKLALILSSENVVFSFIVATGITMCCNFLGQKFFVFKQKGAS